MLTKMNKKMKRMAVVGLLSGAALFQAPTMGGCESITDSFWTGFDAGWNLTAGEDGEYVSNDQQSAEAGLNCLNKADVQLG